MPPPDLPDGVLPFEIVRWVSVAVAAVPMYRGRTSGVPLAVRRVMVGAVPVVADAAEGMRGGARVRRPGGRWGLAVTHPMRWIFPDDPGEPGLTVAQSYFDRTPYVEVDRLRNPTYVEHHRTLGDRVREIVAAGLVLEDLIEPEWPADLHQQWGQWSPLRGALFPGTAIFCCRRG